MCGSGDARTLGRRLNGHQGLRPRRKIGVMTTVVRCQSCGLIYANPQPLPDSLAKHYDVPPEEYWSSDQLSSSSGFRGEIATFQRLWTGSGKPRALDVGAGAGETMLVLEKNGFNAYGFEPSATFRDYAIDRGVDPTRLQLSSVEEAQSAPASFDFITFGAVLEHVQDPAAALARALSWVAPQGLVHVEVPSAKWLIGRTLNMAYRARGLEYVTNLSPMHVPFHLYEFTPESFAQHGERAGYDVIESEFYPCETFLPRPVEKIAQRIMAATNTGMQLAVWLRAVLAPSDASEPQIRANTRLDRSRKAHA
jgi:SAM-dependent methyltransferase